MFFQGSNIYQFPCYLFLIHPKFIDNPIHRQFSGLDPLALVVLEYQNPASHTKKLGKPYLKDIPSQLKAHLHLKQSCNKT